MEPALPAGALVAVRSPDSTLAVGTVVVVRGSDGREDVKRIAAGPGDRFTTANGTDVVLDRDEFAVVGDNALASTDSRHHGPVRRDQIVAVARFCYWPPRAWKRFRGS